MRFLSAYPTHENAAGLNLQIATLYQEEIGDYPQAVAAYDRALAAGEAPLAEVRYRQGECHEKTDRIDLALAAYGSAADEGATADAFRIASLARIAELAEERGEWSAARAAWQRILDANGKPEWNDMARERISLLEAHAAPAG